MAAVTISSGSANLDDPFFVPLNVGETITINGGATVIINSDTIATTSSLGGPANVVLGSITINGGTLLIDGRYTRLLDYSAGSGTPISMSWVTGSTSQAIGQVISVYGTTSGTIKLRSVTSGSFATSSFESGSLFISGEPLTFSNGTTATAGSTDRVGFLTICGRESSTLTTNRLANVIIKGTWYEFPNVGTGGTNQSFLPPQGQYVNHFVQGNIPAIWVETYSGSNDFKPWVNFGPRSAVIDNSGSRGNIFFHCPHNAAAGTRANISSSYITCSVVFTSGPRYGNIIPSGSRVRIPNVHLISCLAADTKGTSSYHTTAGTRYDLTTTNAGVIDCDTMMSTGWYWSLGQSYYSSFKNCGLFQTSTTEIGDLCEFENCGFGVCHTVNAQNLALTANYGSSVIKNCNAIRLGPVANATTPPIIITSCKNVLITGSTFVGCGATGTNGTIFSMVNCSSVTMSKMTTIGGEVSFINYCDGLFLKDCTHIDYSSGSSTIARDGYVFTNCNNVLVDGFEKEPYPIVTTHPRNYLYLPTSCNNVKIRNIGSIDSPLTLQNQTANLTSLVNYNRNMEVSRVYITQSRTGFLLTNNSNAGVLVQNCWSDPLDAYNSSIALNMTGKGNRMGNGILANASGVGIGTSLASVYGTHFYDLFINDTTGSVGILMTEKSSDPISQTAYTIVSGSPVFNSAGALLMRTVNDSVEWEWPHFIIGHTGFSLIPRQFNGTNPTNHLIQYKINKGSGFGETWTSASVQNLSSENSEINALTGFKMKFKLTCITSSTTNAVNAFSFYTSTTRDYQTGSLYPLEVSQAALTFTNVQSGSEIRVYTTNTQNELSGTENASGSFSYNYLWSGTDYVVDVQIISLAYEILRYEGLILGSSGLVIPLQQRIDRNYYNPVIP
jgi:hypothetical protein